MSTATSPAYTHPGTGTLSVGATGKTGTVTVTRTRLPWARLASRRMLITGRLSKVFVI